MVCHVKEFAVYLVGGGEPLEVLKQGSKLIKIATFIAVQLEGCYNKQNRVSQSGILRPSLSEFPEGLCFQIVVLKTLESPLDSKDIKFTLIITGELKEINPKYSSEGLMLKLKLQYFGYLI